MAILAWIGATSGCSTVSSVQGIAPEAGRRGEFQGSPAQVQAAAIQALSSTQLRVQRAAWEGDSVWVIVASEGMTFWSYGEIVRIRGMRVDSATTAVWLVSQRRLETNVAAKDWTETLFERIGYAVRSITSADPAGWLVYREGGVLLLDVSIAPGDTTPFHTHDAAVMYLPIALSPTEGQVADGPWTTSGPEDAAGLAVGLATTDYLFGNKPLTHRVTNVGHDPFRVLEILNYSSGASSGPGTALPGELQHTSSWFRQSTLVLPSGKATHWYTAPTAVVLLLPGQGAVTVERDSSIAVAPALTAAGSWTVIPAGARYRIRSEAAEASLVICVQVRH